MSAEEEHCPETLETLKFAGRCSQVETKAVKNVVCLFHHFVQNAPDTLQLPSTERALIRAKDKEIEILRRRLESLVDPSPSSRPESDSSGQITDVSVKVMECDGCILKRVSSPSLWRSWKAENINSQLNWPN